VREQAEEGQPRFAETLDALAFVFGSKGKYAIDLALFDSRALAMRELHLGHGTTRARPAARQVAIGKLASATCAAPRQVRSRPSTITSATLPVLAVGLGAREAPLCWAR